MLYRQHDFIRLKIINKLVILRINKARLLELSVAEKRP